MADAITRALAALLVLLAGAAMPGAAEARLTARSVSAGSGHTCALLSDATVKCWGTNRQGQLGDGTRTRRLTAVAVQGLTGVTDVSAGWALTCAALADGTARCWGANDHGQVGDGTTTRRSTPVPVLGLSGVIAVSAGATSACALLADHTVACWGDNSRGALGIGTRTGSPVPVAVPGLTDVTDISLNDNHACAVHAGGTVSCWGWTGALGPVEDAGDLLSPAPVPGLADAISVGAAPYRACAVTARALAECWTSYRPPEVVDGFAGVTAFSSSLDGQQTVHSCAIVAGGAVKCQSDNPYMGQIGIGLTQTRDVVTVRGLRGVTSISAASFYTCAAPVRGGVACWGANDAGYLGDGTTLTRFRPVAVRGIDKPASGATLDAFRGSWYGHERSLRVTARGRAKSVVYLGCCTHVIDLWFQLSRVRGTYMNARARARITRVRVFDRSAAGARPPRVGQVGTVRLKRGIITEPFTGWNYCDEANSGNCGA